MCERVFCLQLSVKMGLVHVISFILALVETQRTLQLIF